MGNSGSGDERASLGQGYLRVNQQRSASIHLPFAGQPGASGFHALCGPSRVPWGLVPACCSLVLALVISASAVVPAALHHLSPAVFSPVIPIAPLPSSPRSAAPPSIAALVFSLLFTSAPSFFIALQRAVRLNFGPDSPVWFQSEIEYIRKTLIFKRVWRHVAGRAPLQGS
jgi:hypothetical protein